MIGGGLEARIERGPNVDRLGSLIDQRIQLRQRPVGEITHAVLVRTFAGSARLAGLAAAAVAASMKPFLTIVCNTTPERDRAASMSAVGE